MVLKHKHLKIVPKQSIWENVIYIYIFLLNHQNCV